LLANEQVASLREGINLARATLQDGKAKQKLQDVIACSRALSS
jgi:anthranilate phosphoribosyltransferase